MIERRVCEVELFLVVTAVEYPREIEVADTAERAREDGEADGERTAIAFIDETAARLVEVDAARDDDERARTALDLLDLEPFMV